MGAATGRALVPAAPCISQAAVTKTARRVMNYFKELLQSNSVNVSRFYHSQSETHEDPKEECTHRYSLNFIEQGNFKIQIGKKSWLIDERSVFVSHPAMVFRCKHSEEVPKDVCFSIGFNENFVADIQKTEGFDITKKAPCVFRTNRLSYLQFQLSRLIKNDGDKMALETLAGELFASIDDKKKNDRAYKTKQLNWYAERVIAARELIETHYAEKHSLESLSNFVGMSRFHFTRIFKELTGTPPHQLLINVRLANAAVQLLDGISVTNACFACGFANLSHFIRLFQRTFGVTPSQFQKQQAKTDIKRVVEYRNKHIC
jgi:AraC-like DNA-binding protein